MNPLRTLQSLPVDDEPPPGARDQARRRLLASLAVPLASAPDIAGGSGAPPPRVAPPPTSAVAARWVVPRSRLFSTIGVSVLVGIGLGAAGMSMMARHGSPGARVAAAPSAAGPAVEIRAPENVVVPAASSAETPAAHTPREDPALDAPPSRALGSAERSASSSLAAERGLLDKARAEVAAGEASAALQLTADHARRYPGGRLREEREALAVNALVLAGRTDEARERAELFARTYPNSFLQPSIDAALAARR
jgi:hypothetical protein